MGYNLQLNLLGASGVSSILWSCGRDGGNFFASSSEKSVACRLNSGGKVTPSLACCLAYSWAISTALCVLLISTGPLSSPGKVTPIHGTSSLSSSDVFGVMSASVVA